MYRPQCARPRCYLLDLATRNRQFCRGPLQAWWRRVSSRVCSCALCRWGFNSPSMFVGWFAFSRRRLPSNGLSWGFAICGWPPGSHHLKIVLQGLHTYVQVLRLLVWPAWSLSGLATCVCVCITGFFCACVFFREGGAVWVWVSLSANTRA